MKRSLKKIRIPEITTIGIMLLGFCLGVLQKWMDGSADNIFPAVLQQLDIGNFFGRLAIWVLLGTSISVYSKTPLRASINTFGFLISMLSGYYLYCNYILGFLPRTYMMIWIAIACLSFFAAYVCWYAKGDGILSLIISSGIIGVLFAQAFSLTQGFYVYNLMEVIIWILGLIILRRRPKEFIMELVLSVVIAFLYQLVIPYWG